MKCARVDDMLLMQQGVRADWQRAEPRRASCMDDTIGHRQALYDVSMAWAIRAKMLAAVHCRVTLISTALEDLPCTSIGDAVRPRGASILNALAKGVHRTAFHEDRSQYGVHLDLDDLNPTAGELNWLMQRSKEFCCAMRGGHFFGQRLVRQPWLPRDRHHTIVNQGGTCIVTGGLKGLGLAYGVQLAKGGCNALVLASRSGVLAVRDLSLLAGGGVSYAKPHMLWVGAHRNVLFAGIATFIVQQDASDPSLCRQVASWAHNHLPSVHVSAHAAGVPAFDLLADLGWKQFADVVLPKVGQ